VLRDGHAGSEPVLLQPRYGMSLLRGPMTRVELEAARHLRTAEAPADVAA
jgi:hypothetical protein